MSCGVLFCPAHYKNMGWVKIIAHPFFIYRRCFLMLCNADTAGTLNSFIDIALSSIYISAYIFLDSPSVHALIASCRLLLIASNTSPCLLHHSTASVSCLFALQVHNIILFPYNLCCFKYSIKLIFAFPISG